jgi:glycosyltransferase A (GT-A) superfamily protein (DUF2064 family)
MLSDSAVAGPTGLVVMLKHPQRSKTRLAAEIGELAQDAAQRLWACALEDAVDWPGPVCLAPAEADDRAWLLAQYPALALHLVQGPGNLGQRINHVDRQLRGQGYRQLLFIGTDCPAMNRCYLEQAAAALGESDVVLGPARDGGVVLMGARRAWPELADLPWSTAQLGRALALRCRETGSSVATLAELADVDAAADLRVAAAELREDGRPARRALSQWLAQHSDRLGLAP